jgi:mannose-6-phosphate isomerase class I
MGTHRNSPSHVLSSNEILSEHLSAHPQFFGDRVINRSETSNGNLPFLFKVLSIEKALSIQTHPDKETAEKLHAEEPDIYKGTHNFNAIRSLIMLTTNSRPEPQTRNGDSRYPIHWSLRIHAPRPNRFVFIFNS